MVGGFRCFVFFLILLALTEFSAKVHGIKSPATDFRRHRIVQPIVHHARTRREITTTRYKEGFHHSEVTIKINIDDEEYVLDLRLNEDLITDGHVISYQKDGRDVQHWPKIEELDLCQYGGSVRDKPGSWAAVSTCRGVRGVIYDGHRMRYIEPVTTSNDITSNHYIYQNSDRNKGYKYGYENDVINNTEYNLLLKNNSKGRYKRELSSEQKKLKGPYKSNNLSRYVELVLVADHGLYLTLGSRQAVHRYMRDIANIVNSYYSPLNIFIALVGVKIWTERDEISIVEDPTQTLNGFLKYRKKKLSREIKNDNAHLIISKRFKEPTVGIALRGQMCTYTKSGGVSMYSDDAIGKVAAVVSHEIGHNFGMDHDDWKDCGNDYYSMMCPYTKDDAILRWSSYSLKSMALAFDQGTDICLRNKPKRLFFSSTCGNGFVEAPEECDCGLAVGKRERNACHSCCNPDTCRFRSNATCASGECCDLTTCRLKSAGTECRPARKQCDLPEYCTGHSEFCPNDLLKMDTTPCGKHEELRHSPKAYCVRGSCKSHTDQCQLLWGPTGRHSPLGCYIKGLIDCGYDRFTSKYTYCSTEDLLCGRLQCQHMDVPLQMKFLYEAPPVKEGRGFDRSFYDHKKGKISQCDSVVADVDSDEYDPGLAPDGAKCGENKMCLKRRCVSVKAVRAEIARRRGSICPSDCNGHGICNSEGQCHCEIGFAPPDCSRSGPGGSLNSGPASDPREHSTEEVETTTLSVTTEAVTGVVTDTTESTPASTTEHENDTDHSTGEVETTNLSVTTEAVTGVVTDTTESTPASPTEHENDTAQYYFKNAMYVIFLGILPLCLIIFFIIYYSRNQRRKSLCCLNFSNASHLRSPSFLNQVPSISAITSSLGNIFTFKSNENSERRHNVANNSVCGTAQKTDDKNVHTIINLPKIQNNNELIITI